MIKKTITYTDFNGLERTENFYFHFSRAEILEQDARNQGKLADRYQRIATSGDGNLIMDEFRKLIFDSYGEKSEDGRRFIKSPELSKAFEDTPAYDELFVELTTNSQAAEEFVKGIMPAEMRNQASANGNGSVIPDARVSSSRPIPMDHQPKASSRHAAPESTTDGF